MIRKAHESCVTVLAFVAAGLLLVATPAHADVPALTLKQLLAVQDPGPAMHAVSRPLVVAQAETSAGDAAGASPNARSDEETPSALTGAPAEVEETEAAVKKPVALDEEEGSVFKTWWFWALTAAVIGGTVALGVWAAQPEEQPAGLCSPNVIACFGDGR